MLNKAWNKHTEWTTKASETEKDDKQTKGVSGRQVVVTNWKRITATFNHSLTKVFLQFSFQNIQLSADEHQRWQVAMDLKKNIYWREVLINPKLLKGIDKAETA